MKARIEGTVTGQNVKCRGDLRAFRKSPLAVSPPTPLSRLACALHPLGSHQRTNIATHYSHATFCDVPWLRANTSNTAPVNEFQPITGADQSLFFSEAP